MTAQRSGTPVVDHKSSQKCVVGGGGVEMNFCGTLLRLVPSADSKYAQLST